MLSSFLCLRFRTQIKVRLIFDLADIYAIKICFGGFFIWIRTMILYNYVSAEAGLRNLETGTLGFIHLKAMGRSLFRA